MPIYRKISIIGVGLMGGSIGLALRDRSMANEVVGIGRTDSEGLEKALECGAVDRVTTDLAQGVADAEVVVVCCPLGSVVENVCEAIRHAPAGALITDVGSTKDSICSAVHQQFADNPDLANSFVGSHPLAGDHLTGPENARADLLEGRTVVVTPSEQTPSSTVDRARSFWQPLCGKVIALSPSGHDRALAVTSHLPHLVASSLVASTPYEWLALAAGGWSDTTRIAAADPDLWAEIFSQNRVNVLEALERFIAQLRELRTDITDENWPQVQIQLANAKRNRDALGS